MKKISVCIITKNEERVIERCIQSVPFADEVIVVDSGSIDKTVEIAKKAGAHVIHHDWPGWAAQKNYAVDQAKNDWVLSLDADEWLPTEAQSAFAESNEDVDAYFLARRTFFLGTWIRHSGWYPDRQIRLFRKSVTKFSEVPVHEKVIEPEKTAILPVDILHESYTSLEQYFAKNAHYIKKQAEQQQQQSFLLPKLFAKPVYRFLQIYIWQQGFLDGWRGLQLAVLRSWYEAKVILTIMQNRRQKP